MKRPGQSKKKEKWMTLEPSKKQADVEKVTADFHKTDEKELRATTKEKKM
jgi:hypothetical protein